MEFKGSVEEWKAADYTPPRLAKDPGNAVNLLAASPRLIRALTYNARFESCADRLATELGSGWLQKYLNDTDTTSDTCWDTCLLVAESGVCNDEVMLTLWTYLPSRLPNISGNYRHALNRILQTPPRELDLEAKLVELGFTEILESVDRLTSAEEIRFYLDQLTEPQFRELQTMCGGLDKDAIIEWSRPRPKSKQEAQMQEARIQEAQMQEAQMQNPQLQHIDPLPKDPPRFMNAYSLWQWHYDVFCAQFPEASPTWLELLNKSEPLLHLWDTIHNPGSLRLETSQSSRILILAGDHEEFFSLVNGPAQWLKATDAAAQLKAEAARTNPIFGESLMAAAVEFRRRNDSSSVELSRKLDALDVLNGIELSRYMLQHGADLCILPAKLAYEYGACANRYFTHIFWPREPLPPIPAALTMHLLASNGCTVAGVISDVTTLPFNFRGDHGGAEPEWLMAQQGPR